MNTHKYATFHNVFADNNKIMCKIKKKNTIMFIVAFMVCTYRLIVV